MAKEHKPFCPPPVLVGESVYFHNFEGAPPQLAYVLEVNESTPTVEIITVKDRYVLDGVRHITDPSLQDSQASFRHSWDYTPYGAKVRELMAALESPAPAKTEKK